MIKLQKNILVLLATIVFLAGCATTWQYIGQDNARWKVSHLESQLPQGWVKFNSPIHLLCLTKDGMLLQRVAIYNQSINKELTNSKRKIKEDMLIQEVAEIIVDDHSLNKNLRNLKIIENKPANVGGAEGFKLTFTYDTEDFLKYETILYGFVLNKKLYQIEYTATKQHYFNKDVGDFENFISNLKVR